VVSRPTTLSLLTSVEVELGCDNCTSVYTTHINGTNIYRHYTLYIYIFIYTLMYNLKLPTHTYCIYYAWISCTDVRLSLSPVSVHLCCKLVLTKESKQNKCHESRRPIKAQMFECPHFPAKTVNTAILSDRPLFVKPSPFRVKYAQIYNVFVYSWKISWLSDVY
jgi:hypothetical protein